MKKPSVKQLSIIAVIGLIGVSAIFITASGKPKAEAASVKQKAVQTVTAVTPQVSDWPLVFSANGSVAAWQEAIVGSELNGIRLDKVEVNVGDVVHHGQVLARFVREGVMADVAQKEATLEVERASLFEAQANADRARTLASSGALSAQQTSQYKTAERSANARVMAAEAALKSEQIRLRQTEVTAPDDGVISARSATVGAVVSQGQELFKVIRKNRLEWRAEVTSSDLLKVKPGMTVKMSLANGATVEGTVRIVAPTVDAVTRNALVYVDLPIGSPAHPGMFASGRFELGHSGALTIQQSSVVMLDGFSYVYRIGPDNKVVQSKITLGRRIADRVEVLDGLTPDMRLVGLGAGFLNDGDIVNVVPASTETLTPQATTKVAAAHSADAK